VILHGGKPSSPSLARLAKLALVPVMSLGMSENSLALRASSLQGIATSKFKKLAKQFDKSTKIVYLYNMNKTVEFRQARVKIKRANGEILSVMPTHPLQDTAPTASQWRTVLEKTFSDRFHILEITDWGIQSATLFRR
jgi:hypothetical protein